MWEGARKERVRELRGYQFPGEGEFEKWWEESEKERQRGCEIWKERQRELRKMRKEGERWAEWVEKEEKEEEQTKGQACKPVRKQVEETYIDDY
jgi:hypothetical protein